MRLQKDHSKAELRKLRSFLVFCHNRNKFVAKASLCYNFLAIKVLLFQTIGGWLPISVCIVRNGDDSYEWNAYLFIAVYHFSFSHKKRLTAPSPKCGQSKWIIWWGADRLSAAPLFNIIISQIKYAGKLAKACLQLLKVAVRHLEPSAKTPMVLFFIYLNYVHA